VPEAKKQLPIVPTLEAVAADGRAENHDRIPPKIPFASY
jgi:hypothetical protein